MTQMDQVTRAPAVPRRNTPFSRNNTGFQWGILLPLGLILLAIAAVLFFFARQKADDLRDHGIETRATVTQIGESKDHAPFVIYHFKVPHSDVDYYRQNLFQINHLRTWVDRKQLREIENSHTIPIRYAPQDPWTNMAIGGDYQAIYSEPAAFAALGIVLMLKSVQRRIFAKRHGGAFA